MCCCPSACWFDEISSNVAQDDYVVLDDVPFGEPIHVYVVPLWDLGTYPCQRLACIMACLNHDVRLGLASFVERCVPFYNEPVTIPLPCTLKGPAFVP